MFVPGNPGGQKQPKISGYAPFFQLIPTNPSTPVLNNSMATIAESESENPVSSLETVCIDLLEGLEMVLNALVVGCVLRNTLMVDGFRHRRGPLREPKTSSHRRKNFIVDMPILC